MSVSASINIKLAKVKNEMISSGDVIRRLLSSKWTLNDNGKVSYLPLSDNGDYDWKWEILSIEQLMNIIEKKEKQNETIGVSLTWENTNIGGALLIWNKGDFSFNLTINRKLINNDTDISTTDVSWYLEKLLPAFSEGGHIVESLSFEQHL